MKVLVKCGKCGYIWLAAEVKKYFLCPKCKWHSNRFKLIEVEKIQFE